MHVWMCSLVSQEQYLVSIILIVEKAGSRLCVEPNIIKICRSTVLRARKAEDSSPLEPGDQSLQNVPAGINLLRSVFLNPGPHAPLLCMF